MRATALVVLLLAAGALAGCGGSGSKSNGEASKAPAQVLVDMKDAAHGASAVHISGHLVTGGTPVSVDIRIVRGKGGEGELTENGASFRLVRIGDKAYVLGSDAFYTKLAGAATAQIMHGKWLQGSATQGDFASLVPLTDIDRLMTGITSSHGTLHNDGETTFAGRKVVAIRDSTQGGTLYVAAAGRPYPVAITAGGKDSGTLSFDRWDEKTSIEAPKGAVDVSKLLGGG